MKPALPLLAFTLAVASCATPYKSGQTPDDVYYSAARPEREYVQADERREESPRPDTREDRFLRMRLRNRDRWSQFDDYYSDPYAYHSSTCNCQCPGNPRLSWGYYYSPYSPYYHGYAYVPLRPAVPNRPRNFNFESYRPPAAPQTNANGKPEMYGTPSQATGTNTSTGNTRGGMLRGIFNTPASTSSSSSSSSGSSSSSSSGSSSSSAPRNAPVRRF